jgi:hypothetical protein
MKNNKKVVTKEYIDNQNKKALGYASNMLNNSKQLGSLIGEMLEIGKKGQEWLIVFSEIQKKEENQPALDTISRQAKRFFKAKKMDLSIKGLGIKTDNGKKQQVEISPKIKPSNDGAKKDDDALFEELLKIYLQIEEKSWAIEELVKSNK